MKRQSILAATARCVLTAIFGVVALLPLSAEAQEELCPEIDFSIPPEVSRVVGDGGLQLNFNSGRNFKLLTDCLKVHFDHLAAADNAIEASLSSDGNNLSSDGLKDIENKLSKMAAQIDSLKELVGGAGVSRASWWDIFAEGAFLVLFALLVLVSFVTFLLVMSTRVPERTLRAIAETMHVRVAQKLECMQAALQSTIHSQLAEALEKHDEYRQASKSDGEKKRAEKLAELEKELERAQKEFEAEQAEFEKQKANGAPSDKLSYYKKSVSAKQGKLTRLKKKVAEIKDLS